MVINPIKENLKINKLVASKREVIFIESDVIVPDSKPDILNTICTSGIVSIYKKEVLDNRVRLDGAIDTYIMYLADNREDEGKIRGISTTVDFSETVNIPDCKEGMLERIETKIKSIECKVINGRKIGIKIALEVNANIYSNEEVEIINDIEDMSDIKILKENLTVNSLIGMGETKIYAKDTISVNNEDNIAEILKSNVSICDKDIKISYNKILTKAEALVKIMYLTEDNRINIVENKIPVVGFIDIPNVTENNTSDIDYDIKNVIIKLNQTEEHSIYVEIEIGVKAFVYEEKQINLIQDLYSPCEDIQFETKKIITMTNKQNRQELKQIREKVQIEQGLNERIMDVDVIPSIENENKLNNRVIYEGNLDLNFITENQNSLEINTKTAKIPFEYAVEDIANAENINTKLDIEITNKDFIVQENGVVTANIDLKMTQNSYENTKLNLMNDIQTNGERIQDDYSIIMYIVKKGDTLWKIAKTFGSTVEDIARINGIEDENKISIGQKIFIPRYVKINNNINRDKVSVGDYA